MNPAAGRSEVRGPSRTADLRRNRGWADADWPDSGIHLLFLTPLLARICVVAGDVEL